MMTRDEHLAWAKARALEELTANGEGQAMASFLSDLTKHPDVTPGPHRLRAMMQTVVDAYLDGPEAMRQWIEGFP